MSHRTTLSVRLNENNLILYSRTLYSPEAPYRPFHRGCGQGVLMAVTCDGQTASTCLRRMNCSPAATGVLCICGKAATPRFRRKYGAAGRDATRHFAVHNPMVNQADGVCVLRSRIPRLRGQQFRESAVERRKRRAIDFRRRRQKVVAIGSGTALGRASCVAGRIGSRNT